jgi:hypothetical protein
MEMSNFNCIFKAWYCTMKTLIRNILFSVAVLVISVNVVFAQDTWDGGGDGVSWNDDDNWVDDSAPTSTDDVVLFSDPDDVIPGFGFTGPIIITIGSNATCASLSTSVFEFSPPFTGDVEVTLNSLVELDIVSGNIDIGASTTLNINGLVDLQGGNITNSGTWNPGLNSELVLSSTVDQTIPNLTLQNLTINKSSGSAIFDNGTVIVSNAFNLQAGTINLTTGITLELQGPVSYTAGSFNITGSGSSVRYAGGNGQVVLPGTYVDLRFNNETKDLTDRAITIAGDFINTLPTGNIVTNSTITFEETVDNQIIPRFNYNNLIISGARTTFDVEFATGTTTIFGDFTANATFTSGGYDPGSSTIDYAGSGSQDIAAIVYNNLTNSGGGPRVLPDANLEIQGSFSAGSSTFDPQNGTVTFTGNGQTIPAIQYYDLITTGTSATLGSGTTQIERLFTPGSTTITASASNTVSFNGPGAQSIPVVPYNNIQAAGSGAKTLAGNLNVSGDVLINSELITNGFNINLEGDFTKVLSGTFSGGSSTITFDGSTQQDITSNGCTFSTIVVNNTGASVQLIDELDVDGSLTINPSATLDDNGQTITVAGNWIADGSYTASGTVDFDGTTVVSGTNPDFNDITITGVLTAPSGTMTVAGDWMNDGTFNNGDGTIEFDGTAGQNIAGTGTTILNDVNMNTTGGSITNNGAVELTGNLTLGSGVSFDADGGGSGIFTIKSVAQTSENDGYISEIPAGSSVTGQVTFERFIAAEPNGDFKYFGFPITDLSLADIGGISGFDTDPDYDFPVTGNYTNTAPAGQNGVLGENTNNSFFRYNEAGSNYIGLDNDLMGGTTTADVPLTSGTGYAAFTFLSTDIIMSVTGTLEQGDVPIPATTNGATFTGFNLIGNPYPAPIDFDDVRAGNSNVGTTMYQRCVNTNGTTSFVEYSSGFYNSPAGCPNTNMGGQVAAGQAFWTTVDDNLGITFTESMKIDGSSDISFFEEEVPINAISVEVVGNGEGDKAFVRLIEGASGSFNFAFDGQNYRNGTVKNGVSDVINVSTFNASTDTTYFLNSLSPNECELAVNIFIQDFKEGEYTMNFDGVSSFVSGHAVLLKDNFLEQEISVVDGSSYDFSVTTAANSKGENRFDLLFVPNPITSEDEVSLIADNLCSSDSVSFDVLGLEKGLQYTLLLGGAEIAHIPNGQSVQNIKVARSMFESGNNLLKVRMHRQLACVAEYVQDSAFIFSNLSEPEAIVEEEYVSCGGGTFDLSVSSNQTDASFRWYGSLTSNELIEENDGSLLGVSAEETTAYFVSAVNENGCEGPRLEVPVIVNAIPEIPNADNFASCGEADQVDLVASGLEGGTYIWYADEGGNEVMAENSSGTLNLTAVSQSTTYYVSVTSTSGCESAKKAVEVIISDIPEAPETQQEISVCGLSELTIEASSSAEGAEYFWYRDADGTDFLEANTSGTYTLTGITSSTSLFVSVVNATGCESSLSEISIAYADIPQLPVTTGDLYSACGASPFNIQVADVVDGNLYKLFADENKNTLIESRADGNFNTTVLTESATYFVLSANAAGCESDLVPVDLVIKEVPEKPIVSGEFFACESGAFLLEISGGEENVIYRWYENEADNAPVYESGELTFETPVLTASTEYFVSVINTAGCEGEKERISLIIGETAEVVLEENSLELCAGENAVVTVGNDKVLTGTYQMYDEAGTLVSENTTGIFEIGSVERSSSYNFGFVSEDGCLSGLQLFNIVAFDLPSAPTVENVSSCGPSTITISAAGALNGERYLLYESMEAETPLMESVSGEFDFGRVETSQVYFISMLNTAGCEGERVEVTININDIPDLPEVEDVVQCESGSVRAQVLNFSEGVTYQWFRSNGELIEENTLGYIDLENIIGEELFSVLAIFGECASELIEFSVTVEDIEQPLVSELPGLILVSSVSEGIQWYRNGKVLAGETNDSLQVSLPGEYSVVYTTINCSAQSLIYRIDEQDLITGLEEFDQEDWLIYPNPVNDRLFIDYGGGVKGLEITFFSISGVLVKVLKDFDLNATRLEIDISDLQRGNYIIIIDHKEGRIRQMINKL